MQKSEVWEEKKEFLKQSPIWCLISVIDWECIGSASDCWRLLDLQLTCILAMDGFSYEGNGAV